jgi:hypothetical protein
MATTVNSFPRYAVRAAATTAASARWHAYTAVVAAACVMIGVYWDISWHMSIGRDSFWTPAHLLIQAGGLIAGISSGYVAIRTTFFGTDAERDESVSFWGFRAPFGAWICVWGCGAMLTSAPFDNWWHNAYGLDVRIISPPHALLALGIYAIVVGALLLTLAQQNRASEDAQRKLAWVLAATGGLFVMNFALFLTEYGERRMMHSPLFYEVTSLAFPFALASMARAIKLRWAATSAAVFFTGLSLMLMWTLQLFPATPKLGPIYQHITHMVTLSFPLLVIVPAFFIDLALHRLEGKLSPIVLGIVVGTIFVAAFIAAQWPFASFLMYSPLARGPLFNADNFVYWMSPKYEALTRRFDPPAPGSWPFPVHLVIMIALASLSAWRGLALGRWMTKVRR